MLTIRPLTADDAEIIVSFNENTNEDFLRQWAGCFYTYPLTKEQITGRYSDIGITVVIPKILIYPMFWMNSHKVGVCG